MRLARAGGAGRARAALGAGLGALQVRVDLLDDLDLVLHLLLAEAENGAVAPLVLDGLDELLLLLAIGNLAAALLLLVVAGDLGWARLALTATVLLGLTVLLLGLAMLLAVAFLYVVCHLSC